MKERPILFSTDMVQAILNGSKTQTRRIVKKQYPIMFEAPKMLWNDSKTPEWCLGTNMESPNSHWLKSPYGVPGDLLWVRETFTYIGESASSPDQRNQFHYKASTGKNNFTWKPSIHMPKKAARIWLKVNDVRVERLQDISEEDAKAEGVRKYGPFGEYRGSRHPNGGYMKYRAYGDAVSAFECIWESINGAESWKANPWVWVVDFEVISTNGKP